MLHIDECIWDDENVNHLWEAHQVTPDDVEELLFDVDGEEASYVVHRDGDNYVIFGKTGGRPATYRRWRVERTKNPHFCRARHD